MNVDRLIERALQGLAFFIPFYVFGIPLGGFDFTVSTFLLIALGVLFLLRGHFYAVPTAWAALFLGWCLMTALPRYPVGRYLFSWLGLGVVLLPLCGALPALVDRDRILRALIYGAVASLVLAAYEIGVALVGFPPLENLFSFGLWSKARTHTFLGIRRVKAAFVEPAHYARYLVFFYAILHEAIRRGFDVPRERMIKAGVVVALLATLSLSGVVLALTYVGATALYRWRHSLLQLFKARFWGLMVAGAIALYVGLSASGIQPGDLFGLFFGRFSEALAAARSGALVGSEGSRINSTMILFEYLGQGDVWHVLFGEGYANADAWLRNEYSYLRVQQVSFARGDLHNTFSVVGLSTGVVGLLLYIGFLWSTITARGHELPVPVVAIWLVSHFATGALISYQSWSLILIARVVFTSSAPRPAAAPPASAPAPSASNS